MYMYPDNLKGKPVLWLWYLKDIGIIGVSAIFSVIGISQLGLYTPIVIIACYAFLTMRFNDTSIFDFIKYASDYFFFKQVYFWQLNIVNEMNTENKKKKRRR